MPDEPTADVPEAKAEVFVSRNNQTHGRPYPRDCLYSRMRDAHIRVWYAPENVMSGQKIHEQIERAIRIYDKLLLVLSENSMRGEWLRTEIRNARKVENEEGRRKLFPLRLVDFGRIKEWKCFDSDIGKDLAVYSCTDVVIGLLGERNMGDSKRHLKKQKISQ